MQEALALRSTDTVAGFEGNGGFLLMRDLHNAQGAELRDLPTRDALLPMLAVLAQAVLAGCSVSSLQWRLPARFSANGRLQNFSGRSQCPADGAADARPFGLVAALFGCWCNTGVDQTDGVRMRFKSGDFMHFRPSGNASELRCYA